MPKIALLTSGGDAPGMNAAIRAVVRRGINSGFQVCGIQRGYAGFFDDSEFPELNKSSVADIIHRGGTILLTARSEEMHDKRFQDHAAALLKSKGIDGLIVIGGEGSFRGAMTLAEKGINVIGIPATIDNDINCTELTIGFDTAVNTILEAINRLRDTATSHERIFILEVMGRHSGYLALAAGLAGGAESILVPEVSYTLESVCKRLQRGIEQQKSHSIIVVAEGAADVFKLNEAIRQKIKAETRVTVLGHIQRGGSPSAVDRLLGSRMGSAAIDLLRAGRSGLFTAYKNDQVIAVPLKKCFKEEKPFPYDLHSMALNLSR